MKRIILLIIALAITLLVVFCNGKAGSLPKAPSAGPVGNNQNALDTTRLNH